MGAGDGFGGKVAIVTGGGSGIGAALAAELRRQGATVVTADLEGGDVELDVRDRAAVSALCPGSIDTPILDSVPPADLPAPASSTITGREFMAIIEQKPVTASSIARPALRGVARNRAVIVVPSSAKALWYLQRTSPQAMQAAGRLVVRRVLRSIGP